MAKRYYNKEFVHRKGQENRKALNRSVYIIETHGVRNFDIKELKRLGNPIIKEVRKRLREIEEAGLEQYSPAYQYIKRKGLKISLAGNNINNVKHELYEANEFLHSKTSTVEGAKTYKRWLDNQLGTTTKDERDFIWGIVHELENEKPQRFMDYNYDETIKIISTIAQKVNFDHDTALEILNRTLDDNSEFEDVTDINWEDIEPLWKREDSMSGL